MVGGSAWFIANQSLQALETSVNQVAEDVLIDTANLLAVMAEQDLDLESQQINIRRFATLMPAYLARQPNAKIYARQKIQADLHIYLTDVAGKVIYDSTGQSLGKDFSHWHDVYATLKGQYGARVSPFAHPVDSVSDNEKGLFIAAPIYAQDRIIGVLTVIKANRHLDNYLLLSNRQIVLYALLVLLISLVAGAFITWWLWRSIRKLSRYAKQLGRGKNIRQPRIIHNEFKPLADAMQNMYEELAGKEYVENYIHTMAHELKSPLSGIIASTELLQQDLPSDARQQFTQNIYDSATRMSKLIDRLLHLAMLEKRHEPDNIVDIDLAKLFNTLLAERYLQLQKKQLTVKKHISSPFPLRGEPTLIAQSLANLLDNAIAFSHPERCITLTASYCQSDDYPFVIRLHDGGDGIADFAKERLFERFYSTPLPDTQQRSSGLGLAFVKEAIALHNGKVTLENAPVSGAVASIFLPTI